MANKPLQSIQFPGLPDKYTVPQMDSNFDGVSGKIPDSKKVHDEIDSLKEDLSAIADLSPVTSKTYFTFTAGRKSTGSANTSTYSSNTLSLPAKIVFDSTKYRISLVVCNDDESVHSSRSWATTSPIIEEENTTYTKFWLEVQYASGTGDITSDIADVTATTYNEQSAESEIVTLVKANESNISDLQNYILYVSAEDGNDTTGNGSALNPYATIGKAVGNSNDTRDKTIYVKAGTYEEKIAIQNKKRLTIRLWSMPAFSASVPNLPLIHIKGTNNALVVYDCGSIDISDVWFDDCTETVASIQKVKDLHFTHCIFSNSGENGAYNGLSLRNSNAVIQNCIAYNTASDGFNIHEYGNTVFLDCVAHDCGDDGISHHDGCSGAIIGGEFYNCVKGGVATPTYGAKIDIQGVYSHDNAYGIYTSITSGYSVSKTRISNCVLKDNSVKDIYINGCNAVGWNNIYDTKQVVDGYTFTEYS